MKLFLLFFPNKIIRKKPIFALFFLLFIVFFVSSCAEEEKESLEREKIFAIKSTTIVSELGRNTIIKNGKGVFVKLPGETIGFLTVFHLWGNEIFVLSEGKEYPATEIRRDEKNDLLLLSVQNFPITKAKIFSHSQQSLKKGDSLFFSDQQSVILSKKYEYLSLRENFSAFPVV
jgi:hypothetical protein